MPQRKKIDKAKAQKIQKALKAATFGAAKTTGGSKLEELLKLHDRSGDGLLDAAELTLLIRRDFKITPYELADDDIATLVEALDDDGTGTLSCDELQAGCLALLLLLLRHHQSVKPSNSVERVASKSPPYVAARPSASTRRARVARRCECSSTHMRSPRV